MNDSSSDSVPPSNGPPTNSKRHSSVSAHFVDKLMDKLVTSGLDESTSKKQIEKRMNDPDRKSRQSLSVRVLTSNLKKLTGKLGLFFSLQYGVIHIITWRRPAKTISCLILYTTVCFWPHLVLAYPLVFFLFGVVIPGYYYRHPMSTPEIIKVKKRGQSLFGWLFDSDETSIVDDYLDEVYESSSGAELVPVDSTDTSELFSKPQLPVGTDDGTDGRTTKAIKSQVTLLMNLKDFQNLTTDLLKGLDKAEEHWYDTVGFRNEKLSTMVFYGMIFASVGILFLGQYMPWRAIFVSSEWILLCLCHPNAKKYLKPAKKAKAQPIDQDAPLEIPEPSEPKVKKDPLQFIENHIIVDDSPESRIVEVWELQTKSILQLQWSFYCYTSTMFSQKESKRINGNRPDGVDSLSKVQPPHGWKFDFGLVNKWAIDFNPDQLLKYRCEHDPTLVVMDNEAHGWIYDTPTKLQSEEIAIEFRRRRLYRECFRYSRAPNTPS